MIAINFDHITGGWICHDEDSCRERAVLESPRMSSARWPPTRSTGGILSADPTENPHLSDANHVFVPYCSSDSWSGTRRGGKGQLSFLGSAILRQVIAELSSFEDLLHADELYLSGSSAGAIGVLVNLDAVSDALTPAGVNVRGIVDSGWFLDDHGCGSHDDGSFPSSSRCKFIRDLKVGMEMWRAKVPESCRTEFADEPWKCYIGYRMYPLIKCKEEH